MINGFFDLHCRLEELSAGGDPLVRLNAAIDWELFRPELETLGPSERKSPAGRPPFDPVLMFKILVLQSLYNLSDDAAEYQIRDRLSFMRFLGLSLDSRVPDAKTVWLFREKLTRAGLTERLFARFDAHLKAEGFAARKGQIVDASIVPAPRPRNTREENEAIQSGQTPAAWMDKPALSRQKDLDARWTKKRGQLYFGYKNHLNVDVQHKLIRLWAVTNASVHDSQLIHELMDEDNTGQALWADSAYQGEPVAKALKARGICTYLQAKGQRGRPLTEWERMGNQIKSRVRSRVEHVFGMQSMRAGGRLIIRTVGLARARCKIGLRNLAYNLTRFEWLTRKRAASPCPAGG
jgi:IS5 family transposase